MKADIRRHMRGLALLTLGAFTSNGAFAGVYVELVSHDLATNKSELAQKMYVQGNSGRFVEVPTPGDAADGARESAMVIKDGTLYAIDDAEKNYVVLDKATLEKVGKKMAEAVEKVKEQLSKMPAEQREQMQQMLAKQVPGLNGDQNWTVEAVNTGKADTVDGRKCQVWDVKRNGELDEQLCVVPFSALPGKENFQAVFANFAKVFGEISKTAPTLAGLMSNEFSAQEKINGFPVRSRDYENGRLVELETVLRLWREEAIPASMFEVPAGYQRKTMEDLAGP